MAGIKPIWKYNLILQYALEPLNRVVEHAFMQMNNSRAVATAAQRIITKLLTKNELFMSSINLFTKLCQLNERLPYESKSLLSAMKNTLTPKYRSTFCRYSGVLLSPMAYRVFSLAASHAIHSHFNRTTLAMILMISLSY